MDDVERLAPLTPEAPALPEGVPPLAAEDHVCADCPMDFATTTVDDVRGVVVAVPQQARDLHDAHPDEEWRIPGADGSWCAAEYLCHVRDVYAVFTVRLHRARTESDPPLEPMLNDLRARRFDYAHAELRPVVDQLHAHVEGFLAELDRVGAGQWAREVHRYPGERRTTLWLARQAAHEGRHHLRDITGALRGGEQESVS